MGKHTWLVGVMAVLLAFAQYAQCEQLTVEPSACEVHCVQADQPGSAIDEASPPVPAPAFYALPGFYQAPLRPAAGTLRPRADPPGPSLQVLFCTYQT